MNIKNKIIFSLTIFVPIILCACTPPALMKSVGTPIEDGRITTGLSSEETTYNVDDEITVNYVVDLASSFYGDSTITAFLVFKDGDDSDLDFTVITPTTGNKKNSGIEYEWTLLSSDYNSETKEFTFTIPAAGTYKVYLYLHAPAISEDDWSGTFTSDSMEFTVVE